MKYCLHCGRSVSTTCYCYQLASSKEKNSMPIYNEKPFAVCYSHDSDCMSVYEYTYTYKDAEKIAKNLCAKENKIYLIIEFHSQISREDPPVVVTSLRK